MVVRRDPWRQHREPGLALGDGRRVECPVPAWGWALLRGISGGSRGKTVGARGGRAWAVGGPVVAAGTGG